MTTPLSINPLRLPEIRIEVGRYLKRPALARCTSVCREWNQTFTLLLYSVVDIRRWKVTIPPIEVLRLNMPFIKSMSVTADMLHPSYSHLLLPNLETLKLCLSNYSDNIEFMIQNHKNIRSLELSCMASDGKNMYWKSVASLPHLEKLTIRDQYGYETDIMWDICGRLKKFDITNLVISGLVGAPSTQTTDFHLLRDLTISKVGSHITVQPALMMKCQNIERLEWRVDLDYLRTTAHITTLIQDFIQKLESGKWPKIKSLAVEFDYGLDETYARIIRALSDRTLEELDVSSTRFSELAFNELKHRFQTLRVLNIRNCLYLTSANVLEILASCRHLQSLTADRIYAQYMDSSQEWPCRKTLQYLSIEFELGQEPNHNAPLAAAVVRARSQELNEIVFTCLGQLYELKHLSVSYYIPEKYSRLRQIYDPVSIPLKIHLSKGLQKLVGLKRLNHFSVGALAGSLGRGEIVWMMENWPNLDIIEGFSKTSIRIPMKRAVKQKGIT
ncbi:hypothetical protein BGX21_010275, partial [Mortierella sp. AD011]